MRFPHLTVMTAESLNNTGLQKITLITFTLQMTFSLLKLIFLNLEVLIDQILSLFLHFLLVELPFFICELLSDLKDLTLLKLPFTWESLLLILPELLVASHFLFPEFLELWNKAPILISENILKETLDFFY